MHPGVDIARSWPLNILLPQLIWRNREEITTYHWPKSMLQLRPQLLKSSQFKDIQHLNSLLMDNQLTMKAEELNLKLLHGSIRNLDPQARNWIQFKIWKLSWKEFHQHQLLYSLEHHQMIVILKHSRQLHKPMIRLHSLIHSMQRQLKSTKWQERLCYSRVSMKREIILMVLLLQKHSINLSMLMEIQFYCHLTTRPSILSSNKETMQFFSLQMSLKLDKLLLKPSLQLLVHSKIELNSLILNQMTELDYSID